MTWRIVAACLLAVSAIPAQAQQKFDLERLWLDTGARGSLVVGNGEVAQPWGYRLSLAGHYEYSPLVVTDGADIRGRGLFVGAPAADIVRERVTLHLVGSLALPGGVEVGVRVPVVVRQVGDDSTLANSGLAAPSVGLRYAFLQPSASQKYSAAVAADVATDLASAGVDLGQNKGWTIAPRLELGRRADSGRWLVAVQAGALLRTEKVELTNGEKLQHEATAGLAVATAGAPLRYEASLRGYFNFDSLPHGVELLGGVRWALTDVFELFALAGPGFLEAPGTPTFRGLLGIALASPDKKPAPAPAPAPEPKPVAAPPPAPAPAPVDVCAPGQAQPVDRCPDLDADGDGVPNGKDRCPAEKGLIELQGCPAKDSDGDGVADHLDKCPAVAGLAKYQGCPPPDRDGDGVTDDEDACPDQPGVPANKGCPPARAEIKAGKIDLREKVFFDTGKATIQQRSFGLLDDVSALLKANPGVGGIEIQGHTDDRGGAAPNKALSQKRAEAVKAYLVGKGVGADRLSAVGYGEEKPAEPNTTAKGREANRRVEFVIRGAAAK